MTQTQHSNVHVLEHKDLAKLPPDVAPEAVRRACAEEMEAHGLSISRVSREIGRGVSQATLSRWLRGTYDGDVDAVADRVRRWLDTRRDRAARALGGAGLDRRVELGATEDVEQVLSYAQAAGDIVIVHGPSGTGKSMACEGFAGSRSAAYVATMSNAVSTMAGLLSRIAEAVGAGTGHGSALRAEEAVVGRLHGRGALLIVDDAHHLRRAALISELRCLRDRAGCGLALVGEDVLWTRIAGSDELAAVTGRTGIRWPLPSPSASDVLALATGVLGRAPDDREARLLTAAAAGDGALHAVRRLLVRAWVVARGEQRDAISPHDLQTASEEGGAA